MDTAPKTPPPPPAVSRLRRWIGLALCIVLFAIVIAMAAGRLRTFRVTSDSMLPTIATGDCLLFDCLRPLGLRRGDIVATMNPRNEDEWLCKRLVGMPGDRIEVPRDGFLRINGARESSPLYPAPPSIPLPERFRIQLGPEEYFVLGDNRWISYDSFDFGPVRGAHVMGRLLGIYWPPSRFRLRRIMQTPAGLTVPPRPAAPPTESRKTD